MTTPNESSAPVLTPTPTDLSRHLRYIAKVTPDGAMPQLAVKTVLAVADEIERYYGGMMAWKKTAEAKDVASVAQDREKFSTMQGMADCMDMVRNDLIEMGVIDKTIAPMFIPEAVARYIKSGASMAVDRNAVLDEAARVVRGAWGEAAANRILMLKATAPASAAQAPGATALWTAVTRLERQDSTYDERMAAADGLRKLAGAPADQQDASGAVLGQIAAKLREALAPTAAIEAVKSKVMGLMELRGFFVDVPQKQVRIFGIELRQAIEAAMPAPQLVDIKVMVNRFLGWPLPKTFLPDCGITFNPPFHGWPTGTNLMNVVEAKAMFEHCVAGVQAPSVAELERKLRYQVAQYSRAARGVYLPSGGSEMFYAVADVEALFAPKVPGAAK